MSLKKIVLRIVVGTFCLIANNVIAQNQKPLIETDEKDAISIKDITIATKIIGDIAHTTYVIEVFNTIDRQLSGEIQFPLSDHQAVVGFSLDIEGELREAVGVDKVKGRAAYEDIVSDNVDPALLEKTEGNNFKTKIYPIPANGSRIISLEIIENLVYKKGSSTFNLPIDFKEKIENKDISIQFIGFSNELEIGDYESFKLKKDNETVSLFSSTANNVNLKITPKNHNFSFYQEHQGEYFYYSSTLLPDSNSIERKPKRINVIWDISRSRKDVIAEEIEFLKELAQRIQNVQFNITHFNTSVIDNNIIKVRNGNTRKLEKHLRSFKYDGATEYGCVRELPVAELNLMFSDGLSNFGDTSFIKSDIPTYTLTSQTSFNPSKLTSIARANGGVFINLKDRVLSSSVDLLLKESVVFSGYKEKGVQSYFPTSNTKITDRQFTSVARGKKYEQLSLEFNDTNISLTPINIKKSTLDLQKFFAIQKVKELSINPEENKKELLRLGLTYNLLTDYTSLIVLETIQDYISNEIIPPSEDWKKLYYDNIKLAKLDKEINKIDLLYDQVSELGDLLEWMHPEDEDHISQAIENIEDLYDDQDEVLSDRYDIIEEYLDSIQALNAPKRPTPIVDVNYEEPSSNNDPAIINITVTQKGENYLVTGTIGAEYPLPGANVILRGTSTGVYSDFDGNFSIEVPPNSILEYSYFGYETIQREITLGSHSDIMNDDAPMLDEVVVVGYGTFNSKKYKNAEDFLLNSPNTDEYQIFKTQEDIIIKKKASNVTMGKNPLIFIDYDMEDFEDLDQELLDSKEPDYEYDPYDEFSDIRFGEVFSLEVIPPSASQKIAGALGKDGIIFVYTNDYVEDESINIPIKYSKHIQHLLSKKVWSTIPLSLQKIKKYSPLKRYKKYLEITETEKQPVGFYMAAGSLFAKDAPRIASKIWSNIAEIQLDNHENIRTLGYLLRSIKRYDEAIPFFEKIVDLRSDEPIAHRDLAITYALANDKDRAITILKNALEGNWILYNQDPFNYTEVMNTLYNDYINLSKNKSPLTNYKQLKEYVVTGDLRVVLTWTSSDTDIDLHLITPSGEDFYYGNSESDTVRYNTDMTDGYGPEEIIVKTAEKGTYTVLVDFYADRQQTIHGPVGLSIEIYKYFGTDKEERTDKVLTLTEEEDNVLGTTITF